MSGLEWKKESLRIWIVEALRAHGGKAWLLDVADHIWAHHEEDLKTNKKLLLRWQYDMRWAATELRKQGFMVFNDQREPWELTEKGMNGELPWV